MSRHAGASRERFIQLSVAELQIPDRVDAPHITVSPRTASGLLTGAIGLVVVPVSFAGGAIPLGGGFSISLYRAIPTLGEWAALQALTGVAYRDQLVLNDIAGGFGLYFLFDNIDTPGALLVGLAEMA